MNDWDGVSQSLPSACLGSQNGALSLHQVRDDHLLDGTRRLNLHLILKYINDLRKQPVLPESEFLLDGYLVVIVKVFELLSPSTA